MTKILVVDDHDVVRKGLISALGSYGFESVDSAASVKEARSKIAVFNPGAVIVDLNLPDGSGFEIVQWVRSISTETAIIVLSLNEPSGFAKIARASGANSYLPKTQSIDEIVSAVQFAVKNPRSFTSQFDLTADHSFKLTPREFDVLYLISNGSSNQEISQTLFLSISTVKTHISSMLRKLGATNRTSAIKVAREKGLLL